MPISISRSRSFFDGFGAVLGAFHLVANKRLWPYYLFPILLDFLLSASLFAMLYVWSDDLTQVVCGWLGIATDTDWNSMGIWHWIMQASAFVIRFLIYITVALCYWSIRKNIIVALCTPIMAILSDRVEELITGKITPFNGPQFVRDLVRSGLLSLRNLAVEIGMSLLLFGVSLLISLFGGPLALVAVPLLSAIGFGVSSYYFGGSLVDYALERQKMGIGATLQFNRYHASALTGIGAAFNLLLLIPVIGVGLGVVLGTVGATRWVLAQRSPHQ